MKAATSELIVEPLKHEGLALFFDSVKAVRDDAGAVRNWEVRGVCYRPGSRLESLELRGENETLPATISVSLPSPHFGAAKYPQIPDAASARCCLSFAAAIAERFPWLRLYASFSSGETQQVALLRLIEHASLEPSAPFISTVAYGNETFRFYVSNPSDEIQGRHHAKGIFYEARLLEYIRDLCPRDLLVLDVGANVGNHAVYFERILEAHEVVVFEPNEIARTIMLTNIHLNNCQRINTRYAKFGVSDAAGQYRIGASPPNNLGGTVLVADPDGTIATLRLDDVLGCLRVGMIKIDVEGMELAVLRGAAGLIAASMPVIAVEVTPDSYDGVRAFLEGCGYRIAHAFSMYVDIATLVAVPAAVFPPRRPLP
jgi:FkbM family methyltransferase